MEIPNILYKRIQYIPRNWKYWACWVSHYQNSCEIVITHRYRLNIVRKTQYEAKKTQRTTNNWAFWATHIGGSQIDTKWKGKQKCASIENIVWKKKWSTHICRWQIVAECNFSSVKSERDQLKWFYFQLSKGFVLILSAAWII